MRAGPWAAALILATGLLGTGTARADDAAPVSAEELDSLALEEVLARHAAAQGGIERLFSFQTYYARGRLELTGFPVSGTLESWFARPCDMRQSIDLGIYKMTLGCADGVPWVLDANGQITAKRDSATVASVRLSCLNQSFDYVRPGAASIELGGTEPAPNPSDPPRLRLHLREVYGGEMDLLLDPRTWLIVETRGKDQGHEVIVMLSDYRMVQGIAVAFASEQRVPSVGQTLRIALEEATFDQPLPDTLFALPQVSVHDFAFPAGQAFVTTPVLYADNLLFVDVSVGGREPVRFVIDSGAGTTVLDSSYAAALGVTGGASLPGIGGGGVRRAHLASLPPLELAGLRVESQTGAILPLASLVESIADVPVRGVLGFDFLSRFVTRIDYAAGEITLWDPDSFRAPPAQGTMVDAPLAYNLFTLPVTIDGCSDRILLDTGAARSMLMRAFAERCRLLERPGIATSAMGIAGLEEDRTIRLDSLAVAGFVIARPAVSLQTRAAGGIALGPYAGLLGNNVLERFVLTLDYRHQRVTFEKGPDFDHPRPGDRSGMMLVRDVQGRVVVRGVLENSPASRAGLREGDEVIRIEGRPTGEWGPLYRLREVFRGELGQGVRLDFVRDGKAQEARLVLEDYF